MILNILQILALSDALKNSQLYGGDKYGVNGLPRHLRRRTKSHNPYNHTKRPNKAKQASQSSTTTDGDAAATIAFTNRKMRRKSSLLHQSALQSCAWNEDTISNGTNSMVGNKLRRIETHLWHAKRLTVQDYPTWGWTLPSGIAGRGRGSRAFNRKLESGCIMHDASYMCPFLVSGRLSSDIMTFFSLFLDSQYAETMTSILTTTTKSHASTGRIIEATMYNIKTFPYDAIGPCQLVAYCHTTQHDTALVDAREDFGCCIWVHTAIAKQSYLVLRQAIEHYNQNNMRLDDNPRHLEVAILDTRRIEIRGKTSDHALSHAFFAKGVANDVQTVIGHSCSIVPDPRLTKPIVFGSLSSSLLEDSPSQPNKDDNCTIEMRDDLDAMESISLCQFFSRMQASPLPPLPEAAVSSLRATLRQQLALGQQRDTAAAPLNNYQQRLDTAQCSTRCPALFLRSSQNMPSAAAGWSVILPPGWVMPFWMALVFQGVQPVGQREWHWYHTIARQSFFPYDDVDTPAYREAMQRAQQDKKDIDTKIPKGKRMPSHAESIAAWENVVVCSTENSYYIAREMLLDQEATRSRIDCLVKVLVFFVKKGSACQHAMLCTLTTQENTDEDVMMETDEPRYIHKDDVQKEERYIIGYVSSSAPYGTSSRKVPSIGFCAWSKLKNLMQENGKEENTASAYLQNPSSNALYPVKLHLVI